MIDIDLYREQFIWKTKEGERLTIDQMETSHVFNSMKMCFNHLAEAWNGEPVWYLHQYSTYQSIAQQDPKYLAFLVVFFIGEIQRRGDLPEKYREPYLQIIAQLMRKLPLDERALLREGALS